MRGRGDAGHYGRKHGVQGARDHCAKYRLVHARQRTRQCGSQRTGPRAAPPGPTRTTETFLGHAQAVLIVCKCANTIPANLARTLSELGVNGIPFQQAVRTAVNAAGYALGAADVPGAPGTRLVQIVTIIQNARRSA